MTEPVKKIKFQVLISPVWMNFYQKLKICSPLNLLNHTNHLHRFDKMNFQFQISFAHHFLYFHYYYVLTIFHKIWSIKFSLCQCEFIFFIFFFKKSLFSFQMKCQNYVQFGNHPLMTPGKLGDFSMKIVIYCFGILPNQPFIHYFIFEKNCMKCLVSLETWAN